MTPLFLAKYDIIIVGYGPVGAMLANLLGKYHWKVAVFEQQTAIYPLPRAVHLDDESLRIFQATDLHEKILPHLTSFQKMQLVEASKQIIIEILLGSKDQKYGFASDFWFFQPKLESILREGVKRFENISVFEGFEVNNILQKEEENVLTILNTVTQKTNQIAGKYVVACDGGQSFVRQKLGISMKDFKFNNSWLVVDALLKNKYTNETANLPTIHQQICDPKRPTTYVSGHKNHRRWEFMLQKGETKQEVEKIENVEKWLSKWVNIAKIDILRANVYTFHGLLAKKWQDKGVFLAGDAAHMMPPFLGQGLCSGFRDAHNLAWKLDAVLAKKASEKLLESYEEERSEHTAALIKGAITLGSIVQTTAKMRTFLRNVVLKIANKIPQAKPIIRAAILKKKPLKKGFLGKNCPQLIGHLFIQPKVLNKEAEKLYLDSYLDNNFVLFLRKNTITSTPNISYLKEKIDLRILTLHKDMIDDENILTNWFSKQKVDFVVIRPDKYIYDAGRLYTLEKVARSLRQQLNV
ncbi:MAG: bifunctional 3-(3-hydroxy-phenyl)propionate/3-hydroxycinnamic acid hydroxylase [Chitinophagales bacterium]